MATFPLRTGRATFLLRMLAPGPLVADVGPDAVRVRMGWLGGATVPVVRVERISRIAWPWWGGVGVRLGRGLVAFVAAAGEAAILELDGELSVRTPLPWRTRRVVIGAKDLEGFVEAVAAARRAAWSAGLSPPAGSP
ncbi:MAG TPA: hypothetical protein VKD47_06630 [Miltoncostaeaceae bacterium]|nr:hypothetical protein [Miltoncostaeaceae bacterium]